MKKLLILGHNGMLGNAVSSFFSRLAEYETLSIKTRFPDKDFLTEIENLNPDFIINCIGAIPQKKPTNDTYILLNLELPKQLDTLGIPVVQPTTDCEFSGEILPTEMYQKYSNRDATDYYGKSKADAGLWIEQSAQNTKMIRTSIIGHEQENNHSLLDWFLSQTGEVNGYTNHYWNGITTLEWAKQCKVLIKNWYNTPTLTQLGTEECHSKYDLLKIIAEVYKKDIKINPFTTDKTVNKCLISNKKVSDIKIQLQELRSFYK